MAVLSSELGPTSAVDVDKINKFIEICDKTAQIQEETGIKDVKRKPLQEKLGMN